MGRASVKRPRVERAPRAPREPRDPENSRRSGRNAGQAAPCYDERVLDNLRETSTRRTGTKTAHRDFGAQPAATHAVVLCTVPGGLNVSAKAPCAAVASCEEVYAPEDLEKLGNHQDPW